MANVLFVKANNRPAEQAVSVKMYETFLHSYKESHPSDVITELDLYKEELPYYGNDAISGAFKLTQGYDLTAE
jgi:FMN-dependent NADH-azoreductase